MERGACGGSCPGEHRFKNAERASRSAFEKLSAENESRRNVSTELSALVILTYAECMQGKREEGLREAERAMRLVEKALPPDSVDPMPAKQPYRLNNL